MTSPVRKKTCFKRMWNQMEDLSIIDSDNGLNSKKKRRDTYESPNEEPNNKNDEEMSGYQSNCSEIVTASHRSRRKISLSKWDRVGSADSFFKRRLNFSGYPISNNYSSSTSSLSSSSSSKYSSWSTRSVKSKPDAMETASTQESLNQ
ncbi:GSCOCT00014256001.2-RA-CDS [Cotesia congregata]|uniref:Cc_serrich.4_28.3 n=2 Tax=root TaxID=1 RepID=S6CWI8_COTCN|nr:GSCOCG00012784001-RA-CDS [Cotesia congregata]CAD6243560.1 GSCOCT00014256001.2-RA-CDS [Cotesia congregata]CAG5092460.1 cc_serrich.4_28.3 [Cotesia congregata]CCB96407.1 hypothetical protein SER-RICH4 [Bracoviriform congregatae]CCQ71205.1 hypothetical protein SER-RICH4 [Cotesia congregata]